MSEISRKIFMAARVVIPITGYDLKHLQTTGGIKEIMPAASIFQKSEHHLTAIRIKIHAFGHIDRVVVVDRTTRRQRFIVIV